MNANTGAAPGAASPDFLALLARIFMAVLFLVAGINKVVGFGGAAGYFAKIGFPLPELMLVLAIVIEVGGAVLLVIGWQTRWVAWLLILFTVIATAMGHRFWQADAAQYGNQLNHFLKNVAIVGGLLMLIAFGPGARALDKGRG